MLNLNIIHKSLTSYSNILPVKIPKQMWTNGDKLAGQVYYYYVLPHLLAIYYYAEAWFPW